jgi:hypothetical protein
MDKFMKFIAGLSEINSKTGDFDTPYSEIVDIISPKNLTDKDFKKLLRDCEIILSRVKENPQQIQKLINLGLSGETLPMVKIKKELKLTEEDFTKEGGGWIWLLILLILLLLPKCAK